MQWSLGLSPVCESCDVAERQSWIEAVYEESSRNSAAFTSEDGAATARCCGMAGESFVGAVRIEGWVLKVD